MRWRGWKDGSMKDNQLSATVPPKGSGQVPTTKINHGAAERGQKRGELGSTYERLVWSKRQGQLVGRSIY